MNINIRRISKERIANFEKLTGKIIDTSRLRHMFSGKNALDLSKSKNWGEFAMGERITVDPLRQSRGENRQLLKLSSSFSNVEKYKQGTVFLYKGKMYDDTTVPSGIRTDLDAGIKEGERTILLTLKHTHNNAYGGGGSQSNSFTQLTDLIDQAPTTKSKGKLWLGVYVSGDFYTDQREKYKTFKTKYPTTCLQILKDYAKGKKCVVFTDEDLSKKKTTFYNWFIKG